jgi:hypothetical protein
MTPLFLANSSLILYSPILMKLKRLSILFCIIALCVACGSGTTITFDPTIAMQTDPYVVRLSAATAREGDQLQIFGGGFSTAAANNVVTIGDISVVADDHAFVANPADTGVEVLTITVPAGITIGPVTLYVFVLGNTSNADIQITIEV